MKDYNSWKSKWEPEVEEYDLVLLDRFLTLFKRFRKFWIGRMGDAELEPEKRSDHVGFVLGAKIRYAIACLSSGKKLPEDLTFEDLDTELQMWIDYHNEC